MRLRRTDSTTPIAHHEAEDALARAALYAGHTVIVESHQLYAPLIASEWPADRPRQTSRCRGAIAVVMTTAEPLCREGNAKRNSGRLSEERMDRMFAAPRARQRRRRFRIHPPRGRRGDWRSSLEETSFRGQCFQKRSGTGCQLPESMGSATSKASELALAYAMDLVAARSSRRCRQLPPIASDGARHRDCGKTARSRRRKIVADLAAPAMGASIRALTPVKPKAPMAGALGGAVEAA